MSGAQLVGFDNDSYLQQQTEAIIERMNKCNGKLIWNAEVNYFMITMPPAYFRGLTRM